VSKLLSHIKGKIKAKVLRDWGAEEDIWSKKGGSSIEMEKICVNKSFLICTLHQPLLK
jgi:hypothetical protein